MLIINMCTYTTSDLVDAVDRMTLIHLVDDLKSYMWETSKELFTGE